MAANDVLQTAQTTMNTGIIQRLPKGELLRLLDADIFRISNVDCCANFKIYFVVQS